MNRGDVVLAAIPYLEGAGGKRRPVLVVQADLFNQSSLDTIVAAITSNLGRVRQPNQLLIDPAPETASGLRQPSAVRCDRLFTIAQQDVVRTIGRLSLPTMAKFDDCLKAALGLP